jgi:uncharacterized protein YdcH (DUF465 family)
MYFHKIDDFIQHMNKLNYSLPSFARFNAKRAAEVSWMNSKKNATYNIESIFVELFSHHNKVDELINAAGDTQKTCDSNRSETINLLSNSSSIQIDDTLAAKVKGQMSDLLLLTGSKYKTCGPSEAFDTLPGATSSSFPDFKKPKTKIKDKVCQLSHQLLNLGLSHLIIDFPITVNWRTQLSSSGKLKFRQFYPFPVVIACFEKMLFGGIFLHFERNLHTPYCFANRYIELRHRYIKWQHYKYIYSLDFKAFDQTIPNELIVMMLNFLSSKIFLNAKEKAVLRTILTYHTSCLVISCVRGLTFMFRKRRGLMSGSALTNLLGSMVNLFIILYINRVYRLSIDPKSISILGDDIIFVSDRKIELSYLSGVINHHFNMEISVEKSEVFSAGERVFFLGHYFDDKGRYLDLERTKSQLCISENFIPEDVLSTNDRIWSKFCSILFKCSDGEAFYNFYRHRLLEKLRLAEPIGYYYTLFNTDGNPRKLVHFNEFMRNGWTLQ